VAVVDENDIEFNHASGAGRVGKLRRYFGCIAIGIGTALAGAVFFTLVPPPKRAAALPLYARQTGQPCATCHTAFLELTPAGRRFKLGGYTLGGGDASFPFAFMNQPAFTRTEGSQPGGAAPHFGPNDNFADQQVSVFSGGRIADGLGAFAQVTFDSASRRFGWDNTDLRYAHSSNVAGHDLLWGVTVNNNPSVQDVWNTTPAWNFPYISSTLAPQPAASTFLEGAFAQRVLGAGGYGFLDDSIYLELSGYRTLSKDTQLLLGVGTTGNTPIDGVAPYWRAAVERSFGDHNLEVGTFGLRAGLVPLGITGAGTDTVTDVGIDAQYQYIGDPHAVTARISWIHENHQLGASQALGLADNSQDTLRSLHASISYIYDRTWSLTGGRFQVNGTTDPTLYGTFNGSPDSSGWIAEIAYLPFMHGGPSFWPWLNARIGAQYTFYDKFNGAAANFDGLGHAAHTNNTLFLYTWIMF
jgi:hypothetical protein